MKTYNQRNCKGLRSRQSPRANCRTGQPNRHLFAGPLLSLLLTTSVSASSPSLAGLLSPLKLRTSQAGAPYSAENLAVVVTRKGVFLANNSQPKTKARALDSFPTGIQWLANPNWKLQNLENALLDLFDAEQIRVDAVVNVFTDVTVPDEILFRPLYTIKGLGLVPRLVAVFDGKRVLVDAPRPSWKNGGSKAVGKTSGALRTPKETSPFAKKKVVVLGSIPVGKVKAVVEKHRKKFQECISNKRHHESRRSEIAMLKFAIGKNGEVLSPKVTGNPDIGNELSSCLRRVILRAAFQKPAEGGIVIVEYPIDISPLR